MPTNKPWRAIDLTNITDGATIVWNVAAQEFRAGSAPSPNNAGFVMEGPFTIGHASANLATTGVALYTPAIGDRIAGLVIEITEAFDADAEQIGIGYAATTDADLAFKFPVGSAVVDAATPTFDAVRERGMPILQSAVRLQHTTPLVAKAVVGGNTTGALTLWVATIPAAVFA